MESLANKVPNLKVFGPFRSTDPERNPQFTRLLQHTAKAAGQRQPITWVTGWRQNLPMISCKFGHSWTPSDVSSSKKPHENVFFRTSDSCFPNIFLTARLACHVHFLLVWMTSYFGKMRSPPFAEWLAFDGTKRGVDAVSEEAWAIQIEVYGIYGKWDQVSWVKPNDQKAAKPRCSFCAKLAKRFTL